jgi:hypothetical protein
MNTARRIIITGIAGIVAAAGLAIAGPVGGAQAATAGACNAYGAVLAGQGMECSVTVENFDDGVDQYSIVTVLECHGAPFVTLLAPACSTTVTINTDLTTAVTQCNGSLNGGGSSVVCRVVVTNYFTAAAGPVTAVTHNQCQGSGGGGTSPVGDPLNCSPAGLTIGATVTQCNGSVNGGGGPLRVTCDVAGLAGSGQPVLVDQCNGTANGGGSVLICSASFTNIFNAVGLPGEPLATSTTPVVPNVTGGTYGTPGGAPLSLGRFIAAAPAALVPTAVGAAALLAVSGSDSTVPALGALGLVVLGAGALLIGRGRIRRPAHRVG